MHPYQPEASLLPKAQGGEVVVGGDQLKALAAGVNSGLAYSLQEGGANATTFNEAVKGDDFAGMPFGSISNQACSLLIVERNIAGKPGCVVEPPASHLEGGGPMLAKEGLYPQMIIRACRSNFQHHRSMKSQLLLADQYHKRHTVSAPLKGLHWLEAGLLPHSSCALVELGYRDAKGGRRKCAAGKVEDGVDVR